MSTGVVERSAVGGELRGADERSVVGVFVGGREGPADVAGGFVDPTPVERDASHHDRAMQAEDAGDDTAVGGDHRQRVIPTAEHPKGLGGARAQEDAVGGEHPEPPGVLKAGDRQPSDVVVAAGDQVRGDHVDVDVHDVVARAVLFSDLDGFVGRGDAVVDPPEARPHHAHGGEGGGAHAMRIRRLGHPQRTKQRRLGVEVARLDHQLAAEREKHHSLDLARRPVGNQRRRLPAGITTARLVAR